MKYILILCLFLNTTVFANDLSLKDLGFTTEETKVDTTLTETLEKRNSMLKIHQYTALNSLALMTAAMITGGEGEAKDTHIYLGIAGAVTYYTAASFAFLAPEIEEEGKEEHHSGNTVWHRRLAWIHFPALLIGPTLGYLANEKYKKGQTPSGLIDSHSTITKIGFYAFAASALTMTFEF